MAKPEPRTYYIFNRQLGPLGETIGLTFSTGTRDVFALPVHYAMKEQQWIVKDSGDGITQTISPLLDPSLQAAWGEDFVKLLPSKPHVWVIRSSDSGYTINNGDPSMSWGIAGSSRVGNVLIGPDTGSEKQRWIFDHFML